MAPNIASRIPHCVQQSSPVSCNRINLPLQLGQRFSLSLGVKRGLVSSLATGLGESFSQMRKSRSTSSDCRISAS